MTTEQTIGLIIALIVMCIGCLGSILPAIPGTPLVLAVAIGHKLYFGAAGANWFVIILLAFMTVTALVLDYLATVVGAKKFGAGKKGMVGAIIGGLVGLFFNLPGILLGPFIGATVFELVGGRELKDASRAGIGATLGLFAGAVGKIICCVAMMTLFTVNVVWRSMNG
jgi:uncharacterized protein